MLNLNFILRGQNLPEIYQNHIKKPNQKRVQSCVLNRKCEKSSMDREIQQMQSVFPRMIMIQKKRLGHQISENTWQGTNF